MKTEGSVCRTSSSPISSAPSGWSAFLPLHSGAHFLKEWLEIEPSSQQAGSVASGFSNTLLVIYILYLSVARDIIISSLEKIKETHKKIQKNSSFKGETLNYKMVATDDF